MKKKLTIWSVLRSVTWFVIFAISLVATAIVGGMLFGGCAPSSPPTYRCETTGVGTIVSDDGTLVEPSTHTWIVGPEDGYLRLVNELAPRVVAGDETPTGVAWTLPEQPGSTVTLDALELDVMLEQPGEPGSGVARYELSEAGSCVRGDR